MRKEMEISFAEWVAQETMKQAVLVSIRPSWVAKIFESREKTIEVRKSAPTLEDGLPASCLVYCTAAKAGEPALYLDKGGVIHSAYTRDDKKKCISAGCQLLNGMVMGRFSIQRISEAKRVGTSLRDIHYEIAQEHLKASCLTHDQLMEYGHGSLWLWHFDCQQVLPNPLQISDLYEWDANSPFGSGEHLTRPPQSWRYVAVSQNL